MKPRLREAYQLFHEGAKALAIVERNGFRIDTDYLKSAAEQTDARIAELKEELQQDPLTKTWTRTFGHKTNLGSRNQLGHVLFRVLGHKYPHGDLPKRAVADEATIATVKIPFVKKYLLLEK